MLAKELREQAPEELENKLLELRREQFNLRIQQATGQFANTHQFKEIKKNIARIKTVQNEQKAKR